MIEWERWENCGLAVLIRCEEELMTDQQRFHKCSNCDINAVKQIDSSLHFASYRGTLQNSRDKGVWLNSYHSP